MKTPQHCFYSVIIALCFAVCAGCESTGGGAAGSASASSASATANANSGTLVINRAPNFGSLLVVYVSVDGKQVAKLPHGQNYTGNLPAGSHVVSVTADPTQRGAGAQKRITIQKGQTSTFTAVWGDGGVLTVE